MNYAKLSLATLVCCALLVGAGRSQQDAGEVIVRYQLAGRPAVVTRTDLAVEMAFHQRRQELGRQAVEVLVDATVTRKAARQQKLLPTATEVAEYWRKLQTEMRAAGQRPEEFAAVRNTSEAELLDLLALQLAQERLVRAELRLGANEPVSGDLQRLWLQEQRQRHRIEVDPDRLPTGAAATVDGVPIPMVELGLMLYRTADDSERARFVQQIVYLASLEAAAKQRGIEVTAADLDQAIERLAADAARDPRYRGLDLERLLATQGLSVQNLRDSRVFRAKLLLAKLGELLFPDAELAAQLRADAEEFLAQAGPRRRLAVIFLRASEEPNALLPLDFAAAKQRLLQIRERLQRESFEVVARIESQEPQSRAQGGDIGWHHRRSPGLPEVLLTAAFALPKGATSEPVQGKDGCYLVKVVDIEPDLPEAELLQRRREQLAQQFGQELLQQARIEAGDEPAAAPEAGR